MGRSWGTTATGLEDGAGGARGITRADHVALCVGTSRTGKSTLISRVSSPTGEAVSTDDETTRGSDVLDLGLSYSCIDLGDDTDEGECITIHLRAALNRVRGVQRW